MMEGISFDMHWNTWVTGMRAMHAVTLTCFSVRTVHIKANPLHHNRISSKSLYHSLPLNNKRNRKQHCLTYIICYHAIPHSFKTKVPDFDAEKGKQNTDSPHAEGFYIKSVLCFSKPIKDSFGDNHQSIKWLGERDNTQHAGTNLNHTAALGKKSHQGSCHKKQDNTTNTH